MLTVNTGRFTHLNVLEVLLNKLSGASRDRIKNKREGAAFDDTVKHHLSFFEEFYNMLHVVGYVFNGIICEVIALFDVFRNIV